MNLLLLTFLCAGLFGAGLFSTLDTSPMNYFAYAQTETVEGYLNLFHGHFEDGTSLYEFHLFDVKNFSDPPIILEIPNDISIKELLESAGTEIKVKGTFIQSSTSPPFQKMQVDSINPVEPTIELDQKIYPWTDKVYITIIAPQFNLDPNLQDTIGNSPNFIKITTRSEFELDNYILHEDGSNSGVFTGEVILTGFLHDADGNTKSGDGDGNDTIPKTEGNGPNNGFLENDGDDILTVSFEFSEDETVIGQALIRWGIGEVQWLQSTYPPKGTGIVRVIDHDMNLDPNSSDTIKIDVWSDSDPAGITLTVTETGDATSMFEGTVAFTNTDDSDSSGKVLRVAEGDFITAEYEDNTLPTPYKISDELDITSTSFIGNVVPPLERATASNCRVVDAFNNTLGSVSVNQEVQVTCDITNGQQIDQSFAFLVEVKDQNDDTSLSWITGTLSAGQSFSPALSWIPDTVGAYEITAFVWESVDNPTSISPPQNFSITVNLGGAGFNSDAPTNMNGNIVRTIYQESDNFSETYQLLYDSFHDKSKFVFTTHGRENPQGEGALSQFNSLVIPLKFKDVDWEPHSTSYYHDIFFGSGDSVASYFRENSYGKFRLAGEVLDWQNLPNDMEYYFSGGNLRDHFLSADVIRLIDEEYDFRGPDGIKEDFVEADLQKDGDVGDDIVQLTFITNYNPDSVQESTRTAMASAYLHPKHVATSEGVFPVLTSFLKDNGDRFPLGKGYQKGYGVAAHELGHTLNWYHTPLLRPHDTHSDPWSLLSGSNDNVAPPGVVAFQKKKAHWIESHDIMQVPQGQSSLVNLDYLSNPSPSTDKYLMAEIPFGSDGKFYTVEARKESRSDHIPGQFGLMIYEFNPERSVGATERFIDHYAPLSAAKSNSLECRTWEGELCLNANYSELSVELGQTFTDSENNIQIKLDSQSNDSMTLCISNNSNNPIPKTFIEASNKERNDSMQIDIEFRDCLTQELIREDIIYDLSVTQNGHSLLELNNIHSSNESASHHTSPLPRDASSSYPVDVNVAFYSGALSSQTTVTENIQVVPEFETVAIVVLSISIITVISLTNKSKLSLAGISQ